MSNNITPFAFGENLVRIHMDEHGDPWFVAKDVCQILEIQNPSDTVNKVLDEDEKAAIDSIYTSSNGVEQVRSVLIISESGLYSLIFRSRKSEAKTFRKWITAEVLPTLRKTGTYTIPGRRPSSSFPEVDMLPLPPEALGLRSSMRQRLWQDALQTARLDGADSTTVRKWFVFLCQMVAATPPAPTPARDKVCAFFHECCEHVQGGRVSAADLYAAFRRWHRGQRGDMPSVKVFGLCMQEFVRRIRSNGIFYQGIVLKNI